MEKADYIFTYIYYSSKYLYQNSFVVVFLLILDFLPIFGSAIQSTFQLYKYLHFPHSQHNTTPLTPIEEFYTYFTLVPQLGKLIECTPTTVPDINECSLSYYPIIIFFALLLIIFITIIILSYHIMENKQPKEDHSRLSYIKNIFLRVVFNFYDYIFFRAGSLYIIFFFTNYLINSVYQPINPLFTVISLVLLGLYCSITIKYYNTIFIFFKMGFIYPYDEASTRYDCYMLIMKIIISIKSNLDLQMIARREHNPLLTFFSLVLVLMIVLFIVLHMLKFALVSDFIIFQTNDLYNCVRVFLLTYTAFCIVFFYLFYNDNKLTLHIISHFTLMFISFILLQVFVVYKKIKVYKGGELNQMLYLIDHYPLLEHITSKPIQSEKNPPSIMNFIVEFYTNIYMNHIKKCKLTPKNCELCNTLEVVKPTFNTMLIQEIFFGLYTQVNPLFHSDDWRYLCLSFIAQIMKSNNNFFIFNYAISRAIFKLGKLNSTIASNSLVYYKLKISNLGQYTTKVNLLYSLDKQCDQIAQIIKEVESAFFIQILNPYNLVTSSLKLNSLWKSVNKIINKQNIRGLFQSITNKFILEKLFNKKLKIGDNIFDISMYEDILNDNYKRNNQLTLIYNLETHNIGILSPGKDFMQYAHKRLEELFLRNHAEATIEQFKDNLALVSKTQKDINNNTFQFPIKDVNHPQYIMPFKYRYIVLPMVSLRECIIFGMYSIHHHHIIMTKQDPKVKEETIINYSFELKKDLLIPVELLEQLLSNNYSLDYKQLFKIKDEKSQVYTINYKNYIPKVKSLLQKISAFQESSHKTEDALYKTIYDTIERIEVEQCRYKEMKLITSYEIPLDQKNSMSKIMIYAFDSKYDKNSANKNSIIENYNNDDFDNNSILQFNENTIGSTTVATFSNFGNSSSVADHSISSGMGSGRRNNKYLKEDLDAENELKKKQSRNFYLFTFFILGFNIFLILITVLFLVFLIDKNEQFTTMFNFLILWAKVMRLFFNSTLNIFFNVCTGQLNSIECSNSFNIYEKEYVAEFNLPLDFSLSTYFFNELTIKADSLRQYSKELNTDIYAMNEKQILSIIEKDFKFRYLSVTDNAIEVKEDTYKFMNALEVYFNLINMIMENDDYATKPIYILNICSSKLEDIELDNINRDAPLTPGQITGYNLILNFPIYIATFFSLNGVLQELLGRDIGNCYIVVITFFVLLFAIHFVLFMIIFWFANYFRKSLDRHVLEFNMKLECSKYKEDLAQKISTLKQLSFFYKDDPYKIINGLVAKEREDLQQKLNNAKTGTTTSNINDQILLSDEQVIIHGKIHNKNNLYYPARYYEKVLDGSLMKLYSIFLGYFGYSIIFLVLLLVSLGDYSLLINVLSQNVTLDTSLSALTGFLQITLLTNQTEEELNRYLYTDNTAVQNTTEGFVQTLMSQSFFAFFQNDKDEESPIVPKVEYIECSTIFDTIQDELLMKTNAKYLTFDYEKIIPQICSSYSFMSQNNLKVLINELLYRLNQILKNVDYTYEKLYELNNSYELFDIYIIMVILFRPLRNYETITLFTKAMTDLTNKNNWITYIYLCCNIIIEFVIFVLIRKYVIQKFNLINKSMNRLLGCIKK